MSDFEVRTNPDTGALERKVVSWEQFELAQVENEVTALESEVTAKSDEATALQAQIENTNKEREALESRLSKAKSELDICRSAAPQGEVVDEPGSEVEQPTDSPEDSPKVVVNF